MTVPGAQGDPYATTRSPYGWPSTPQPDGWLDGPGYAPALVHPSSRGALVVRVLIAVGLILGLAQTAARPVERTTNDLFVALQDGRVNSITIEWPSESLRDAESATGTFRVDWSGGLRPSYAYYTWASGDGAATSDQGALIRDSAEEFGVPVTVTGVGAFGSSGTGGVVWFPGWPLLSVGAWFAALLLLIAGPQPRLATKWAWFWLGSLPPLWLAFVILEPLPLWARRPMPVARRRLTGGWAFLLSRVLGSVVAATWPDWSDVLTNRGP